MLTLHPSRARAGRNRDELPIQLPRAADSGPAAPSGFSPAHPPSKASIPPPLGDAKADRLRADDPPGFVHDRAEALLRLVETAMGTPIPREQVSPEGVDACENIDEMLESLESEAPHAL